MRERVRSSMPELPADRRARVETEWGIADADARTLVATPGLADYAEAAVAALHAGTAKDVVNWCVGDMLGYLNESGLSPEVVPLAPDGLAELVGLVADGTLSRNQAKDVLAECLREPKRPKQVVAERGLTQVSDEGTLGAVVDTVLADNAALVDEYRTADAPLRDKKLNALMGLAMRAMQGQGNPQLLKRLIQERLDA
jgi:aspartyl-tRNA(Asn)/glutamyl-tRNA(Gln) amidotransferase subunit B